MAAPRFFVALDLAHHALPCTLALPEDAAHHAARVMRLGVGDALTLFSGTGGEYAASIAAIDKRGVSVRVEAFDPVERESPVALVLAQAIAANDAMDYAIRKATELGASAIQPLVTRRSAPLPEGARADKRRTHWQQVAVSACEQCGRNRVPAVAEALALRDWIAHWRGAGIVLVPEAHAHLPSLAAPSAPLALAVGPEGGWEAAEVAALRDAGFEAARLGPRVLRTETAGVAALAAIQVLWGDLR